MRQDLEAGQRSKCLDLRACGYLRQNRRWKHRTNHRRHHGTKKLGAIAHLASWAVAGEKPPKNCFTARAWAMRVLRLRMLAVKNSMKQRPARSPWARIMDGSVSRPARFSAGGGTISSVKMIGCLLDTVRPLSGLSGISLMRTDQKGINLSCYSVP